MSRRSDWSEERRDRERRLKRERLAQQRRDADPSLPPYVPGFNPAHAPRGPSGSYATAPPPNIHEGHELKGQTIKVDGDGAFAGRYDKTRVAAHPPAFEPVPPGHLVTKTTTYLGEDAKPRAQYITAKPGEVQRWEAFWKACEENAAKYSGLSAAVPPPYVTTDDLITLYPLGDPHIGARSWAPECGDNFDLDIASRELLCCVRELVSDSPASREAIIANLGDYLHAQDDSNLTPGHGNKLDVDGRFAKVLEVGHALLRGIVDAALVKHERVTVRNLPGNHDPRVAAELAMWLRAVYEREPRVTIADAYAAHQYDRFGANLFGWHHGDRSKPNELPAIMATDRASDWGQTTERVWHVGHIHHLTRHETPGCIVESHRTMAARDAWHAGRYRAGRSLQAISYHREFGEHSRVTVSLARVRHALARGAA